MAKDEPKVTLGEPWKAKFHGPFMVMLEQVGELLIGDIVKVNQYIPHGGNYDCSHQYRAGDTYVPGTHARAFSADGTECINPFAPPEEVKMPIEAANERAHHYMMKCALATIEEVRKDMVKFSEPGSMVCGDGHYLKGIEDKWGRSWDELVALAGYPMVVTKIEWKYS